MNTIFTYSFPAPISTTDEAADVLAKTLYLSNGNADGTENEFFFKTMSQYTQNSALSNAFSMWSNVASISFVFGQSASNHLSFSNWTPSSEGVGAGRTFADGSAFNLSTNFYIFLNTSRGSIVTAPKVNNWGEWVLAHEIGHAILGAGHPSEGTQDLRYSIMSYPNNLYGVPNSSVPVPLTLGMTDIYLAQQYAIANGGDLNTLGGSKAQDGNTTYTFTGTTVNLGHGVINIEPEKAVMTIWDRRTTADENGKIDNAGGIDTIDASAMNTSVYITLEAGKFSSIGSGINTAPSDGVGGIEYNVGIAINAQIENAKSGSGNDYLIGNDLANTLEGNAGQDTLRGEDGNDTLLGGADVDILDGGLGNDLLEGGVGVDVYQANGSFGTDIIKDTDGQGIILVGETGQADTALNSATYQFKDMYKNDVTGYTFTKLNGGTSIVITKEGDANRIIINDWSETNNLSLSLTGEMPDAPATTLMGDFKKAINENDAEDPDDDTYQIEDNNYVNDGAEAGALDLLYGNGNNNVIDGGDGDDYITGEGGGDYLIGSGGGDLIQGGLGSDTIMGGTGDDTLYAATKLSHNKITDVDYEIPSSPYTHTQANGLNWHIGYNTTYSNGVPYGLITTWNGIFVDDFDGDTSANYIDGGAGNDFLAGGAGSDYLVGGTGKDEIVGWLGDDIILGGDDNDHIFGDKGSGSGGGDDIIDGGHGEDILHGEGGNDIIFGGTQNDQLWGGVGQDIIFGGDDVDQLAGGEGNDYLDGGEGNDILYGEAGDDTLIGGAGIDDLRGGAGSDTFYVGNGDKYSTQDSNDKIIFIDGGNASNTTASLNPAVGGAAVTLDLGNAITINIGDGVVAQSDSTITFADGSQIKQSDLLGTKLNSTVNISSVNNALFGGMLNDYLISTGTANSTLFGGLGNDSLTGNGGSNILRGGEGNDALSGGFNNDYLYGGNGDDAYFFADQDSSGNDYIYDDSGWNGIRFGNGVTVNKLTFTSVDSSNELVISYSSTGSGPALWSIYLPQTTTIAYFTFSNFDSYTFQGLLDLKIPKLNLTGTVGNDTLDGAFNHDTISGGDGDDSLNGKAGQDVIFGENGNDSLDGGIGNDLLDGGTGEDVIYGGDGDDTLDGGAGNDSLIGGAGNDVYTINVATDVVTEVASAGIDTVTVAIATASGAYTLAANVENATLNNTVAFTLIGNALDNVLNGNAAANTLDGSNGNDTLDGLAGNDTLVGGLGSDTMRGALGNDTYRLKVGDGQDVIEDTENSFFSNLESDTLIFDDVISTNLTSVTRDTYNLIINYGLSDSVVIKNHFLSESYQISQFQFSDGVTLTAQQLYATYSVRTANMPNNIATQNNDFIIGTAAGETLAGSAGVDKLYGDAGNDTLDGGTGSDFMHGGLGDDVYYVDSIDDMVTENTGGVASLRYERLTGNNYSSLNEYGRTIQSSGDGRYLLIGTGFNESYQTFSGITLKDTVTGVTSIATGVTPNSFIRDFNISSDGKYIVFSTSATNLAANINGDANVFYRNLVTGETKLATHWSSENPVGLSRAVISADGRYVGYEGAIAPVFQGKTGLYVVDMQTGVRTRVNTTVDGLSESAFSQNLSLSEDGRFALFQSYSNNLSDSNNLAVNDLNGFGDMYYKDLKTGALQLVSITASGQQGNEQSHGGAMSADGRYVIFSSDASNLVTGDINGQSDVFVKDMKTGELELVSKSANGQFGNGQSYASAISSDGRFVAFNSSSTNFGEVIQFGSYIKDLQTGNLSYVAGESITKFSLDSWALTLIDDGQFSPDGINYFYGTPGIYKTENSLLLGSASSVGGIDTVISSVSYTLTEGIENLTLVGSNTLDATGNTSNNILTGNSADNVLSGGLGNDTLIGGEGADVYIYTLGEGHDQINNLAADDLISIDTLRIMGITPSEVTLGRVGEDLVVYTTILTDSITIKNYYLSAGNKIDQIQFDDGTIWDQVFVESHDDGPTNGNDNILGTVGDDMIDALGGDDYVYGDLGNDSIVGGAGNDTLDGGVGNDTMVGGIGNDTYTIDVTTDAVTEATNAGTDTVNVAIATASGTYTVTTNVENATLINAIAYNLTGNSLNNVLTGNAAANVINGGTGNDTMIGGLGNDTYTINVTTDVITENLNEGTDLVNVAVTTAGGTYNVAANVENATLTNTVAYSLTGNVLANVLTGNAAANTLNGGDGNDTLNGGTGTDTMVGGLGDDVYTVDAAADVVTEAASAGTDLVNVAITTVSGAYTLATNVENAILINTVAFTLTGNTLDNVLTGNGAANTLNGGDGNDTLNGLAGNDTMVGGLGNDTYTIDVTTDVITEAASAGTDTVNVAVTAAGGTYTVATNVENATLINTVAYNLIGNASNNVLTGNAAANALNGLAGNDTMVGGAGNDTYTIDALTDVVTENLNEGTDLVNVLVTTAGGNYAVAANIENATLSNTVAYSLTGNALDNILTGNAAANTLNGGDGNDTLNGLAGNDTMIGGLGNDTYTIDVITDVVTEAASAGTDLVNVLVTTAGGTYTLATNVENATLANTVAFSLTGNALDNVLIGNAAANTLNGGDGNDTLNGLAGNDTMVGGLGNDIYTIDVTTDVITEAAAAGSDTVNVGIGTASGTYTVAANVENAILTNTVAYNLTGNALANFLKGNAANNTLTDTAGGNDILQGLAGTDILNDTVGNNLFDGGIGNDTITGGSGRDLFIGGNGNDTITTGTGFDVISFNKGDGADIINASTGADNTISLGGNFAYSDLSLTKSTNDLILKMGATDQITLKDWYLSTPTNKSVINLQVVAEAIQGFTLGGADALRNNKIENFNFTNLVAAFDAAGATANWQLTDARLTAHLLAGSDTAAIGGDLAYQYGKNSNLTGMGLINAQSVIGNANFGQTAQTLNNPTVWQAELVKLG